MNGAELSDNIITQGHAVARAIESISDVDPTGPIEQAIAGLPPAAHKRRLRAIVEIAPSWVAEEILSASEHIGDRRAAVWFGRN